MLNLEEEINSHSVKYQGWDLSTCKAWYWGEQVIYTGRHCTKRLWTIKNVFKITQKPKLAPLVQACEVTETGLSCICRLLAMAVLAVASCGAVEWTRPAPQNILVQRKSNWCSVHSALRSSNVYRKNILEENIGSVAEEIKSSKINTYFR